MTREEIIQGLQFTVDTFLFDPTTGETFKEPRNDMDKTTIDACKGAIELLEQQPCEDAISRKDAMSMILCYGNEIKAEVMDDIKASMIKLPSVQPKPIECEDAISRQAAIYLADELKHDLPDDERLSDMVMAHNEGILDYQTKLSLLPSVQPKTEIKPIGYRECADATLKMWMDNVLTDGEHYRIMNKLNAKWSKMNEVTK